MSTSLSSLVDNLSEKLHQSDKCKDCKSELDYMSVKDNQLIFQCLECKKSYEKDFQIHMNFAMETLINVFHY